MSSDRLGDWFQSLNGRKIWPLDPRPEDVDIEEIADVLSNICRFGGHVPGGPYSVAQHSVYVSRCIAETDPSLALIGLLHDAPEAYLGDIIRPIKKSLCLTSLYAETDRLWNRAIGIALNIPNFPEIMPDAIKVADDRVLMAERRDLLKEGPAWRERTYNAWPRRIYRWGSKYAKIAFMEIYEKMRVR